MIKFDFAGKKVLIIGGCRGLGKELSDRFRESGASVSATSRDPSKYPDTESFKLDVTDEDDIKRIMQMANPDILVYAASARSPGLKIEDTKAEDWRKEFDVDIIGCFLAMKHFKGSRVITIGSIYGVNAVDMSIYAGHPHTPLVYSVCKAGLIQMTRYMACQRKEATFNCVSPGGIRRNQPEEFYNNYSKRTPLGRMAETREVISVIMFLATDEASYITGQNILVDGGWTSW